MDKARILVIAAHPDDEVLGAGGTIARFTSVGAEVHVLIVTEGCTSQYPNEPDKLEVKRFEAKNAAKILGVAQLHFGGLPDMRLDTIASTEVNRCIESVIKNTKPTIVFTQAENDINLDHLIVFRATCVGCRPYSSPFLEELYTYYTPSSSEWGIKPFFPNTFFDISTTMDLKVNAMEAYGTELRAKPHPRSADSLKSIAAAFGSSVGCSYAEPFNLIRKISRK
jgi:LmbE family N-acetylglucosaminyl deacetylase